MISAEKKRFNRALKVLRLAALSYAAEPPEPSSESERIAIALSDERLREAAEHYVDAANALARSLIKS